MAIESLVRDIRPRPGYEWGSVKRRAIVAVVIVCSGWFVPRAILREQVHLFVLAAPVAILAALVLFRWPMTGFPLLVICSLIVPVAINTGTQTGVNVSILLAAFLIGIWLLDMVARQRDIRILPERIVPPLLAIIAISLLSFGFGQIRWLPIRHVPLPAQLGGLAVFILSPGILLVTAHRLRDIRILRLATWLFLFLGGLFILTLLVPSLQQTGRQVFQRAVYDSMFWAWIAAIAFSQIVLNRKLKPIARVMIGLVGLSAFYYTLIFRLAWTSGWLPAFVAVFTIAIVLRPKLAILGALAMGVLLVLKPDILSAVFLSGDNMFSLITRLEAWRIMYEIIILNPLLGVGPANYYAYTPLFRILGYSVNFNSHNNYVDIAAQIGIVGLMCFFWFAWEMLRFIWRYKDTVPDGYPRAYMYGALGGFVAMLLSGMFGDWFLPFVYNIGLEGFRASGLVWMFLGGAVALYYIYHPGEDSEPRFVPPPNGSSNRQEPMRK